MQISRANVGFLVVAGVLGVITCSVVIWAITSSPPQQTPTVPTPTVPGAPQSLVALNATNSSRSIQLSWSVPSSDGGSRVTNYTIYRGMSSGNEQNLVTISSNRTSYTDRGVVYNQTYYYKVSAVNSVGEGPQSNQGSASMPLLVPDVPQSLTATSYSSKIYLSWSTPSSDGGSNITSYKIYRGNITNNETLLTTVGIVLTYTDTSVTIDRMYYYKVSAVNAIGEGAQSSEASIAAANKTAPPPNPPYHCEGEDCGIPGYPMVLVGLVAGAAFIALYKRRLPAKKSCFA